MDVTGRQQLVADRETERLSMGHESPGADEPVNYVMLYRKVPKSAARHK
jgi:hypothetical protein